MPETGPKFLHRKYRDLSTSAEIQDVLDFTKPGEPIPQTQPEARIEAYLEFLKGLVDRPDPQERERGIDAIKQSLYARHVIKPEEISEAYFQSIIRRHREEGHGDIEIPKDQRQELIEPVIEDQKRSLDGWVDYLASPDAKYPDYLKFWTFRSILKMGRYDKDKKKFTERYGGTVSPFPELNREALALAMDAMERKLTGKPPEFGYDISEETKGKFLALLEKENFAKLYGLAIEEFKPISEALLKETKGQWVKYPKGSDPKPLVDSLSQYGTGWCIRGESTARPYLQGDERGGGSDLEIFYSHDQDGNPTVPRVVIVSSGNRILEVRGVAKDEHLDPHIGEVVERKLSTLPDGKSYAKRVQDMKLLTQVERKMKAKEPLIRNDLTFLYEIEAPIEGFGYGGKDPRVEELRKQRNLKEDAPIVLECTSDEIAWSKAEVSERTKVYIGPLFPKIFEMFGHLEHIYTKFPEKETEQQTLTVHPELKTADDYRKALTKEGYKISPLVNEILGKAKLQELKESYDLVILSVADLGFAQGTTIKDVYTKARKFGLKPCPPQIGLEYRLQHKDQPMNEWRWIAMDAITDFDGLPRVFTVDRDADGLWLSTVLGYPAFFCAPGRHFVFVHPRKSAAILRSKMKADKSKT